jgi:hypothetical protein
MRGWVYVISNESMPGIVKVGFTLKDPAACAAELAHTGNPLPYQVDYEVLVHDPQAVERAAHEALNEIRVSGDREWFRCTTQKAVDAIRAIAGREALLENVIRSGDVPATAPSGIRPSEILWTLKASTGCLTHIESGSRFLPNQYYEDNAGASPGFVIRDRHFTWVPLESIRKVE